MNTNCPFLVKYNYPFFMDDADTGGWSNISDWYRGLCKEHCPLERFDSICAEDFDNYRSILRRATVPCPHCKNITKWQVFEEDGISCRYCGERIYHDRPLEHRRGVRDGK